MKKAGWYPDPGSQSGLFRWWNGRSWTPLVTTDSSAPAPTNGLGKELAQQQRASYAFTAQQPSSSTPSTPTSAWAGGTFGRPNGAPPVTYQLGSSQPKQRGSWGLALGALAMLVVISLIVFQAFKPGGPLNNSNNSSGSGSDPTQNVCPKPKDPTKYPHPSDGRVHGGMLSYPRLGSPWGTPHTETRLAFGLDVTTQNVQVEPNYSKNSSWVASVLVGELNAGDGFYAAEEGAQIVARCVLGSFYGDNKVDRTDVTSKATTVDGHEAWLLKMHLTFDIPNLKTKGETAIILIVNTGETAAGIYYASIPDTTPELLTTAESLISKIKVA
ncbi:MAG: DUF2510 domain-containing protein [Propionibacteriaceae bacterium]